MNPGARRKSGVAVERVRRRSRVKRAAGVFSMGGRKWIWAGKLEGVWSILTWARKRPGRGIWIWILGTKAGVDMNFGHEGRGIDFDQYSCL